MLSRLLFLAITVFWVTMNVLLYRSEFRGKNEIGTAVPVAVVWQKMLTAPDDSNLEIFQQKRKLGSFRWTPNVGEGVATGKVSPTDLTPDGSIKQLVGYSIDVMEGMLDMGPKQKRLTFSFTGQFSTNHQWQTFALRAGQRPATWELNGDATTEKLEFRTSDDGYSWGKTFTFEELRHPEKLLQEVTGQLPLGIAGLGLTGGLGNPGTTNSAVKVNWEARNDWLALGRSHIRVYRLQARLASHYEVVVYVSRVGEILRADLPNGIRLLNSRLEF